MDVLVGLSRPLGPVTCCVGCDRATRDGRGSCRRTPETYRDNSRRLLGFVWAIHHRERARLVCERWIHFLVAASAGSHFPAVLPLRECILGSLLSRQWGGSYVLARPRSLCKSISRGERWAHDLSKEHVDSAAPSA